MNSENEYNIKCSFKMCIVRVHFKYFDNFIHFVSFKISTLICIRFYFVHMLGYS